MRKSKHVVASRGEHVPVSVLAALVQAVAELGYDTDAALAAAGMDCTTAQLIAGSVGHVSVEHFVTLNQYCNAVLRDHITVHDGSISMTEDQFDVFCRCLVHSATLGEAMQMSSKFFAMFDGRIGKVTLETDGDDALLHINARRNVINYASFLVDFYGFAVIHRLYGWLIDERIELKSAHMTYPAPPSNTLLISLFDHEIRFLQPSSHYRFDRAYLDRPVVRTAAELNALLELFPYDLMLSSYRDKPMAERVYQVMVDHYSSTHRLPEIGHLSRIFHMTDHTIRRRLTEEKTAYSKIRQRCQINIITDYLRRADMTINEIAQRSGFSDASTFRRAFKQWTGQTPTAYRRIETAQ